MLAEIKKKVLHGGEGLNHNDMDYLFNRIEDDKKVLSRISMISEKCDKSMNSLDVTLRTINFTVNSYLRSMDDAKNY